MSKTGRYRQVNMIGHRAARFTSRGVPIQYGVAERRGPGGDRHLLPVGIALNTVCNPAGFRPLKGGRETDVPALLPDFAGRIHGSRVTL